MCAGRLLYFSAIIICSISGSNTNDLKLVIPAGTKTYHKDGVTHEVRRFVIVPEYVNKKVYLRQNLNNINNGPNTIIANHEVFKNKESEIYNDSKEPANYNIFYGQYNIQNSKVSENHSYENAIYESILKGIHFNYTLKVSPQDYQPKQNINWDGEGFQSLNGNGNGKVFTNSNSNLFNLISNGEFHTKTTDNNFILRAVKFQDVNEKYGEPSVIGKYYIPVNHLAKMGLNNTQMLMFMRNVNNTNKENLKDFWETVSLSTPNKAIDLEQLNKLYVIFSIFTYLKKEREKIDAEIDALIKNMDGKWDRNTLNHIFNIDTINAKRGNVISKLEINSPAYSFSEGLEFITKHKLPVTNPDINTLPKNNYKIAMPELIYMTSKLPEISGAYLNSSLLSSTEADLNHDLQSNLYDDESGEISKFETSDLSNDTIPENLVIPQLMTDLNEPNSEIGLTKFNNDDEIGVQISSDYSNDNVNEPYKTILDDTTQTYVEALKSNENRISEAEDIILQNVPSEHGVNINLIDKHQSTNSSDTEMNSYNTELGQNMITEFDKHLEIHDAHLTNSPLSFTEADMYPDSKSNLNDDKSDVIITEPSGSQMADASYYTMPENVATPESDIIPDLASSDHINNKSLETILDFRNTIHNHDNNTIQGQISIRPELHNNIKVNYLEPNLPISYEPEKISPATIAFNPVETQYIEQKSNLDGTYSKPTKHQFYSFTQERNPWQKYFAHNYSHLGKLHPYQHGSQTYDYAGHKFQATGDKITKISLLKNPSNNVNNQISYQGYLNSNTNQVIKPNDIGVNDTNIINIEKDKSTVIVKPNYKSISYLGGYSDNISEDRYVPFHNKPVITNAKYNYKTNVNMEKAYNPQIKHVVDHDYQQYQIFIEKSLHLQDLKLFFLQIFSSKDRENIANVNKLYNIVLNYIIYLKRNAVSNGYINLVIINIKQYVLTLIRRSVMMSFQVYPYMNYEYRVRFVSTQVLRDIIRRNKMRGYMTTMFRLNKLY